MARSPVIELTRSSLNFAGKQQGKSKKGDDSGVQHAIALVETSYRFKSRCGVPLVTKAYPKLGVFFEVTIGKLIDDGAMGWTKERKRRPFCLKCAEYLADQATSIARAQKTSITPHVLNLAAAKMIEKMQPICVLPDQGPLKIFGTACPSLSRAIKGRLLTMR